MASVLDSAVQKVQKLQQECSREPYDVPKAKGLLNELKLLIAQFPSVSPLVSPNQLSQKELLVARETLEYGAFISVKSQDIAGFERHVAQLKSYYQDFAKELPPSQRQHPILGMYLLQLLSSNRIGEFHTELELISLQDRNNLYIKYPILLEQYLMEGNYNKVIKAKVDVPMPLYSFFVDALIGAVRVKIAACLERAYRTVDAEHARKLLMLTNVQDLKKFCDTENARKHEEAEDDIRWRLEGTKLIFELVHNGKKEIPARELIANTIAYATELERIV